MSKQRKSAGNSEKTGRFIIGRERFAKISAVEGIRLTDAMKKRADDRKAKGLSAEESRRAIISRYR
jgi:hypothetical protein